MMETTIGQDPRGASFHNQDLVAATAGSRIPRRRYVLITTAVIVVAIVVGTLGVLLVAKYIETRREAVPKTEIVKVAVRTFAVSHEDAPLEVEATGFLKSPHTVRIAAETAGKLVRKLKEEGDRVRAEEVVAHIDDELHRKRLDAAKARKKAQQARLEYLQSEVERARNLADRNSIAVTELERWSSEARSLEASLAASQAVIAEAEMFVEKCAIPAPREGLWYKDLAKEGEYLQAGQPVGLLRVVDRLDLEVEVAGWIRLSLEVGQPVTVEILDVEPGLAEVQRVREDCRVRILPAGANDVSHRFPVVLDVPNPERDLVPGLFARARFALPRHEPLLLLPKECVVEHFGRPAVYVPTVDGEGGYLADVRYIQIRELKAQPAHWQVVDGLAAGTRVILSPVEQLASGMPITVEDEGERPEEDR